LDASLSAESVLAAAYGFEVESKFNKYISLAAAAVDPLAEAMLPGTFLVDMLPVLKYIPEWFPGASFKRKAKQWRLKTLELRDRPFEDMKRKLVSACTHQVIHWELNQIAIQALGEGRPSFCSVSLARMDDSMDILQQEDDIKSVAGVVYGG